MRKWNFLFDIIKVLLNMLANVSSLFGLYLRRENNYYNDAQNLSNFKVHVVHFFIHIILYIYFKYIFHCINIKILMPGHQ